MTCTEAELEILKALVARSSAQFPAGMDDVSKFGNRIVEGATVIKPQPEGFKYPLPETYEVLRSILWLMLARYGTQQGFDDKEINRTPIGDVTLLLSESRRTIYVEAKPKERP